MTTPFRRLLSANAVSSIVGAAIQAASAPLFLLVLSINQYASMLLAQTVAMYLAFFLNGFFYFMMNSITHDSIIKRADRAKEMYVLGYSSIAILGLVSLAGLLVTLIISGDLHGTATLIWTAVLASIVNLGYIMVDATFRVRGQYTRGVNILTAARLTDFLLLVAAIVVTRDLFFSLSFNVFTRVLTMLVLKVTAERKQEVISIVANFPNLRRAFFHFASARGQLWLSAYTSLSVMGPQLIVSTFFQDSVAVTFNVHRTYMRIIAALVNIITTSSWPVLNSLHATGESSQLANFLRGLFVRSLGASLFLFLILFCIAPWVFPFLFHGKVGANSQYLLVIGLACVFNAGTAIVQTLYLATNLRSGFVSVALLLTSTELASMVYVGLHADFRAALFVYALFELAVLITAVIGCARTLRPVRRTEPKML